MSDYTRWPWPEPRVWYEGLYLTIPERTRIMAAAPEDRERVTWEIVTATTDNP